MKKPKSMGYKKRRRRMWGGGTDASMARRNVEDHARDGQYLVISECDQRAKWITLSTRGGCRLMLMTRACVACLGKWCCSGVHSEQTMLFSNVKQWRTAVKMAMGLKSEDEWKKMRQAHDDGAHVRGRPQNDSFLWLGVKRVESLVTQRARETIESEIEQMESGEGGGKAIPIELHASTKRKRELSTTTSSSPAAADAVEYPPPVVTVASSLSSRLRLRESRPEVKVEAAAPRPPPPRMSIPERPECGPALRNWERMRDDGYFLGIEDLPIGRAVGRPGEKDEIECRLWNIGTNVRQAIRRGDLDGRFVISFQPFSFLETD